MKMKISQLFSTKRGFERRNQELADSLKSLKEQNDSRSNTRWRAGASAKDMGVKRPAAEW